jgi:NTE family protein
MLRCTIEAEISSCRMRLPQPLDLPWKRAEQALAALWNRFRQPADADEAPEPPVEPAGDGKAPPIGLALQGGGAHGAFTWGVLDRLLEAGLFRFEAISGASAGALNAVVTASGLLAKGPDAAREALEAFWRSVSAKAALMPYHPTILDRMVSGWNQDGTGRQLSLDIATRLVSPYQFNPLGHNPLRQILAESVDFEMLRRNRRLKLYIAATDISTGRAKIFRTSQLSPDVLDASTALPSIHHAVEIDGVHYWDGGYSANPPLIPLVEKAGCGDILLIQIEPPREEGLPVTATEIRTRLARLTFMAPLNRELDALRWAEKMNTQSKNGSEQPSSNVRLHRIDSGDALSPLGQFSKLNPEWTLLQHMRDIGREQADAWLSRKASQVGVRTTFRV